MPQVQVWSSVLGSSLTTITPDGNKSETKVFAGGTLIAKQQRIVINNQNSDSIEWTTADPVTGTTGKFNYTPDTNYHGLEEIEPLGQRLSLADPDYFEMENMSYQTFQNSAGEPEWQCQAPQAFYGGFQGMPDHCQMRVLQDFSLGLDDIFGFSKKEESPDKVAPGPTDPPAGASDLPVPLTPTTKSNAKMMGIRYMPASHTPSADGCTYDAHGTPSCAVRIKDDSIPDFIAADGKCPQGEECPTDLLTAKRVKIQDKEFENKLNNALASKTTGNDLTCEQALDKLTVAILGAGSTFKGVAGQFINGVDGNSLWQTANPISHYRVAREGGTAFQSKYVLKGAQTVKGLTSTDGKTIVINSNIDISRFPNEQVWTFIHEVFHKGVNSTSNSHGAIVKKIIGLGINKVDPSKFDKATKDWEDVNGGNYSNLLNAWIEKYCRGNNGQWDRLLKENGITN